MGVLLKPITVRFTGALARYSLAGFLVASSALVPALAKDHSPLPERLPPLPVVPFNLTESSIPTPAAPAAQPTRTVMPLIASVPARPVALKLVIPNPNALQPPQTTTSASVANQWFLSAAGANEERLYSSRSPAQNLIPGHLPDTERQRQMVNLGPELPKLDAPKKALAQARPAEPVVLSPPPAAQTVRRIQSPDPIIHKQRIVLASNQQLMPNYGAGLTDEELAALSPASDSGPLIQLPNIGDANAPPPAPLPFAPQPLPTETAPPPPPVVAAPTPTPPVETTQAPPPLKPLVDPSVPLDASAFEDMIGSSAARAQETVPPLPPIDTKEIAAPKKEPAPVASPPATDVAKSAPASDEPDPTLATDTKSVAERIPSGIDARTPRVTEPVDIERAKDTSYLDQTSSNRYSDRLYGVKMEVKQATPINWDYELEKAYNALVSGNSSDAISIYKNILDNEAGNEHALFGLATTYHRAGQLTDARKLYAKLLEVNSTHRDGLNNFLVLMADESPKEAVKQLEALEKRNPDFSAIPAQLAVVYQKLGDPKKATAKMFRAVSLAPENMLYRYNLAIIMDKQGNFQEAAKLYRQLVQAHMRGETIPGDVQKVQQRLTFIGSNRH